MTNQTSPTEYETREETIVRHYGRNREFTARATYTVQVPVGTPEYKIPARETTLDMSKVAAAQAWSAQMFADLSE